MAKAWEKIDLEGAGLQAMNQRLVQRLKRRPTAYALWLAFPLGAHRFYLESRPAGLAYLALSALAVIGWLAPFDTRWAVVPLAAAAIFALYDLFWIERRVVAVNKQLRMAAYLGGGAAPPPGYRGRYTEDEAAGELADYVREKERERAGHQPVDAAGETGRRQKAPSFAEQEAMLRELAKRRSKPDGE